MLNQQLPTKAAISNGETLNIHSIFATIQGEGIFSGYRAVFVRLAGCNLQCPSCDTEYTDGALEMTVQEIVHDILTKTVDDEHRLIVITGGEPFRQNIARLCTDLCTAGHIVQIETNGVLMPQDNERLETLRKNNRLFIVCSPKTSKINHWFQDHSSCFKYVLEWGKISFIDGLPTESLGHKATPHVARPNNNMQVYVTPMDSKDAKQNALNIKAAVTSCQNFGTILNLQIHKFIGVE